MKYAETANRLDNALNSAGLRPVELSERSGVSQASISQYLSGTHTPSNESAGKMAKVLGVSPVWLMGFDVPKYLDPSPEKAAHDLYDLAKDSALMEALKVYKQVPLDEQRRIIDMIRLFAPKEADQAL